MKPPHKSPRVRAADLDDTTAAKMLQGAWRAIVARRKIKQMVRAIYKKVWDEDSKTFYYFNTNTQEAFWTKPVFLGDDDLELTPRTMLAAHIKPPKKTPRFTAKDLTPELAAKHLQGAWRSKVHEDVKSGCNQHKNVDSNENVLLLQQTYERGIGRNLFVWFRRFKTITNREKSGYKSLRRSPCQSCRFIR